MIVFFYIKYIFLSIQMKSKISVPQAQVAKEKKSFFSIFWGNQVYIKG